MDLSVTAPDQFFYVTQICFTQVTGTGHGYRVWKTGGINLAQVGSPFETECIRYEPALLIEKNDTLSCTQQTVGPIGTCMVTGILSAK